MKEFSFEYTDVKFALKLLGLCVLIAAVLALAMSFSEALVGVIGAFGVLAIPVVIFLLFKGGINKTGSAFIYDRSTELKLIDSSESIVYADIKSIKVKRYNGTLLSVKLRSGRRFRLHANSNFSNSFQFDAFCEVLETTVTDYKAANDIPPRPKSLVEKGWVLPLLIVMSMASVAAVVFVMTKGEQIPPSYFLAFVVLVPLWMGYVVLMKKAKEKDLI
jgi:hypothetical protein